MTESSSHSDRPVAIPADLDEVRVRFAPSPTGSIHIGGAKQMMYNVLFAHGQAKRLGKKGSVVLRIEDTDQKRLVEGSAENLMEGLRWLGLDWDEGPDVGGDYGPYVQSQRKQDYHDAAMRLIDEGHAYPCFCTPERLQQVREDRQKRGLPPGYDRHCRNIPLDEAKARMAAGEPYVVRVKMPLTGETTIIDLLRGEIVYQNDKIEDLVILKTDGFPTYHLAVVVDDHAMRITHVTRGPEWIPTAPVHIQLYKAFGWDAPRFMHMPLILDPKGGKLSKRNGAVSLQDFRDNGYLPEALLNYLALLGWSLDGEREIFSKADLLEYFTIERVSSSASTFDRAKLDWLNQQWINHHLELDDLTTRLLPYLIAANLIEDGPHDATHPRFAEVRDVTSLLKDRIRFLTEAPELMSYFLQDDLEAYDPALLIPKKVEPELAQTALQKLAAIFPTLDVANEEATEAKLRELADELELKPGQLFMPIRVAVTGRTQSPGLFETLRVIGQARVEQRINQANDLLATASVA